MPNENTLRAIRGIRLLKLVGYSLDEIVSAVAAQYGMAENRARALVSEN